MAKWTGCQHVPRRTFRIASGYLVRTPLNETLRSLRLWFGLTLAVYAALIGANFAQVRGLQRDWWSLFFSLSEPILSALIVSFVFYFLVVHLPAERKRRIQKNNLKKMYRGIKQDILLDVLLASRSGGRHDITASIDVVEKLMDVAEFRKLFEGGRESDEGFYAFRNHIQTNSRDFRGLILKFKLLAKQIDYILHNYDIANQEHFDFLKRLDASIFELDALNADANYDDEKILSGFIWEIFAGWSFISGYRGYDIIEKALDDI